METLLNALSWIVGGLILILLLAALRRPLEWLVRLAARTGVGLAALWAGRRTIPTEDTYFEQLHDKEFSPEEAFLDKDFKDRIRHLCSALKSPYREVALEHFCEEKTAAEIAKAQNKNIKTVQTQIYRSRSMLKALLERSD